MYIYNEITFGPSNLPEFGRTKAGHLVGPQLFVDLRHGKQWQLAVHYIDLLQDEPWAMLSGNTIAITTPIRIP